MTKLTLALTMFVLFLSTILFAQDKFGDQLVQRDGKIIVCQVREIGDDEIKYVMEGFRNDLIFGIDKNKVVSILFSDGREMKFSDSMFGKENYDQQRKNAFKFNFLSPLTGATAFSYERSLKPGSSIEVGLGIIGLGNESASEESTGLYMNVGYKFIKDPDFYIKGMKYAHILKGAYFKPELAFSTYSYSRDVYWGYSSPQNPDRQVVMGAFILNVGKQWVMANRFLVDWYVGAGYGFGDDDGSNRARHFAFVGGTEDFPLVVNAGFKIGLLF